MATLTSTITESISLNGADRGSTNTLSVASVTQVFHRIVTCPTGQDTTVVTFDEHADDQAGVVGALDVEDVKYIRVTNLDSSSPVNLSLQIDAGAVCRAKSNSTNFRTLDVVDFKFSSSLDPTEITVYEFNDSTPSLYLLKKEVEAVAGAIEEKTFTFGNPKKYDSRMIEVNDISEILSCTDSDGNSWYEVPYLAQDTVFVESNNTADLSPQDSQFADKAPYLLKLKKTSRRFYTYVTPEGLLELRFGAGNSSNPDEEIIPNPDNVGSNLPHGVASIDREFDPSNFLNTKAYGLAPAILH